MILIIIYIILSLLVGAKVGIVLGYGKAVKDVLQKLGADEISTSIIRDADGVVNYINSMYES